MTIGGSILLIVLGAILRFAVTAEIAGIDLQVVGVILMIGGAIGLIAGLVLRQRRIVGARTVDTRTVEPPDPDVF